MSTAEIVRQVEFYFSDVNLVNDKFMNQTIREKGGLPLATLLTFKRMSKYDPKEVETAIAEVSTKLDLEEGVIKRKAPLPDLEDKKKLRDDLNNKTAVLKDVPTNWNLDFLQEKLLDSKFAAIRIKKNGLVFVTFQTVEDLDAFVGKKLEIEDKEITTQKEVEWYAERKQNGNTGGSGKPRGGKGGFRKGGRREFKRERDSGDKEEKKNLESETPAAATEATSTEAASTAEKKD